MKTVKIFLGIPIYKDGEIIFAYSKIMKTVIVYSRIPKFMGTVRLFSRIQKFMKTLKVFSCI